MGEFLSLLSGVPGEEMRLSAATAASAADVPGGGMPALSRERRKSGDLQIQMGMETLTYYPCYPKCLRYISNLPDRGGALIHAVGWGVRGGGGGGRGGLAAEPSAAAGQDDVREGGFGERRIVLGLHLGKEES